MVQSTIWMAKSEHQGGLRTIAGDADDGAVGCALPLDLPFLSTGALATIDPLGYSTFVIERSEPTTSSH